MRHVLAFLLGNAVTLLALFFTGPPVMQCLGGALCAAGYPAWFASLSPVDQFLIDHHDLLAWVWLGLGVGAFLVVEGAAALIERRRLGR